MHPSHVIGIERFAVYGMRTKAGIKNADFGVTALNYIASRVRALKGVVRKTYKSHQSPFVLLSNFAFKQLAIANNNHRNFGMHERPKFQKSMKRIIILICYFCCGDDEDARVKSSPLGCT